MKAAAKLHFAEAVTIYFGSLGLGRAATDSFHFSWLAFLFSLTIGSGFRGWDLQRDARGCSGIQGCSGSQFSGFGIEGAWGVGC